MRQQDACYRSTGYHFVYIYIITESIHVSNSLWILFSSFAFASFKTIDEATDAIEKTKKRKIDGRMLRARYADLKGYSGSGKSTKSGTFVI